MQVLAGAVLHLWWLLRRLVALLKSPGCTVTTDTENLASSSRSTQLNTMYSVQCNAMYNVLQCNCLSPECLDGCLGGSVDTEAGPGVGSGGGGHLHQPAPALLQQRQHLNSITVIIIM